MSILSFIADVHLESFPQFGDVSSIVEEFTGWERVYNRRATRTLDALRSATRRSGGVGSEMLFVLGDLFDRPRPHPVLIAAARAIFPAEGVTYLVGNHDRRSSLPGDNALVAVAPPRAIIEGAQAVVVGGARVYVFPVLGADPLKRMELFVKEHQTAGPTRKNRTLLAFHAGIADRGTPSYLRTAGTIDVDELFAFMHQRGIDFAIGGDWHQYKTWERTIAGRTYRVVQCGALVPTGFDNPGLEGYGSLIFYSVKKNEFWREVVGGPRFITISDPAEIGAHAPAGIDLFVRWKVHPERLAWANEVARDMVKPPVAAIEVVPDASTRLQIVAEAAQAARHTSTMHEAVCAYVREMVLPDGVDRDVVAQRTLAHLAAGAADG